MGLECRKHDAYVGFSHCFVCARKYNAQQDARIVELETALAAMTRDRDAQAEAVRVLGRGVLAGQLARARMRECPSTSGGAGGQTIEACLSRMRFHQVPLSIFDDLYAAEEMIHANPIAAAAVKGGGE